jgi:hypothetical protein
VSAGNWPNWAFRAAANYAASIVASKHRPSDFRGKLEAPPGFEPGVELVQSHPRFFLALFVCAEFSRKSLSVKMIAPVLAID